MAKVKVSPKGQIVIPVKLRRKYKIEPHSKVDILELDNQLVILPLPADPLLAARGFLKSRRPVKRIIEEARKEEIKREKEKIEKVKGKAEHKAEGKAEHKAEQPIEKQKEPAPHTHQELKEEKEKKDLKEEGKEGKEITEKEQPEDG